MPFWVARSCAHDSPCTPQTQAVLGPLALETARRISEAVLEQRAKDVMTVAFLAILITAPNGALIIGILGPKLLAYHDPRDVQVDLSVIQFHH